MKLISLELTGFKSFLHRTTFRFDEGVTCIVGPNGCGKSNIVDAVTWVLGERGTKSLRVKEMGDVIFHGSPLKKQVNMAEVTIGLLNEEREYAIKRRIYRDGTNEYFINGEIVRLKDVQDFFLGTGIGLHSYAIIEQGNIEYFAQMKPHERRIAIEETSGITRFEEKKRDAFARMEEVKSNLDRVEDLYGEVAKGLEKAEEESARLRVYNGLKENLRDFDIAFLTDSFNKLSKRSAKLEEREAALASELEAKEGQRQSIREKIRSKDEEIGLVDSVARQMELDIKGKEKDMEARLLEINYLEEETKRLQKTAADLRNEIEAIDARIAAEGTQVVRLTALAGEERAALAETEAQGTGAEGLREARKAERERLEKAVEEQRTRLFAAMTTLTEIKNRMAEKERAAREREARRQRRQEEERQLAEKLRQLEEKAASLRQAAEAAATVKTRLEGEEKALRRALRGPRKGDRPGAQRPRRLEGRQKREGRDLQADEELRRGPEEGAEPSQPAHQHTQDLQGDRAGHGEVLLKGDGVPRADRAGPRQPLHHRQGIRGRLHFLPEEGHVRLDGGRGRRARSPASKAWPRRSGG